MPRPLRVLAYDYLRPLETFPLTVYAVDDHPAFDSHYHGRYVEMAIVRRGHAMHQSGTFAPSPVGPGDVIVVPVGVEHSYSDCVGLELINILFDPHEVTIPPEWRKVVPGAERVFALREDGGRGRFVSNVHLDSSILEIAVELCAHIHDELIEKRLGFETAARGLFCALLTVLSRHEGVIESPMTQAMVRLSDLLDWLNRHYSNSMTTADMAERVHMSRSTLERYFRTAFGQSPREFLIQLRLRKAATLLMNTEYTVAEVGAKVGIEDPSYFARMFRRFHGLPPADFRQRSVARRVPPAKAALG